MNKKKLTIIVCSVFAVLVAGLLVNHFFNWPVDTSETSGDISKASRFSREMESESLSNMEELLKTDSTFKNGIVAAQVVMQTRASQFGALVDMSNEAASNIAAFAEVLKEMNATREMVNNVIKSLVESNNNLNAALGGEECPDLSQSTINASLAYTTLQKQNKLANRFIETTDKYLETAKGDDKLKFVRDQWLEYQQMTAALEGDKASAEALAKKGNLLSGEQALAAMSKANLSNQLNIIASANLAQSMNVDTKLAGAIEPQILGHVVSTIRSAVDASMKIQSSQNINAQTLEASLGKEFHQIKNSSSKDLVASQIAAGLESAVSKDLQSRTNIGDATLLGSEFKIFISSHVNEAFNNVISNTSSQAPNSNNSQALHSTTIQTLGSQIGDVINSAAAGQVAISNAVSGDIRP